MKIKDKFGEEYDYKFEDRTNKHYKQTKLQQSYVNETWFVSTAYRVTSALVNCPPWYFETIVWEKIGEQWQGKIIYTEDSGSFQNKALERHSEIVRRLVAEEPLLEEEKGKRDGE